MLLLIFLIGLCVGSFLNVLASRLPRGEDIFLGRSHCDYCKKILRWWELVPLVSYILQKGHCVRCHHSLSIQYPLSELIVGLSFVYLFQISAYSIPLFISLCIVFSSLFVIFVADLHTQIIPDSMIAVGVIGAIGVIGVNGIVTNLIPALVSFLFFYLLWAATRGRGMGFGDVKLACLMGLFLGYPGAIIAFYIAFLTGAMVGVILMIRGKKKWKSKIAFGPFLVFGTVCAFIFHVPLVALWHTYL